MKKNLRKIVIIISVSLLTLFLINRIFFFKKSFLETAAANITYPFLWIGSKIAKPIENIFAHKKNYHQLLSENILLKQKNEDLKSELIKLNTTLNFEEKSQEILDFKNRYNLDNTIFAKIITKNITPHEHYFFINKGNAHNIKKNMIAVYKLQIIGKIVDVYRWYSKVLLITDKKNKIAAYTNNTNAKGIAQGTNNINKLKFEFVDHFSKIEKDDFVISSGQGLVFPEGFCLGTISKFKKNGLYFDIEVKPLVEIEKLENCLITDQEKINII
jgi:rod shape-determining protein MreC